MDVEADRGGRLLRVAAARGDATLELDVRGRGVAASRDALAELAGDGVHLVRGFPNWQRNTRALLSTEKEKGPEAMIKLRGYLLAEWAAMAAMAAMGAGACSGEDSGPIRAGDPCDDPAAFDCSTDESGTNDGTLLFCEGGTLREVMRCGDPKGCFTEGGNSVGRCFHGDGTGNRCEATGGVPVAGDSIDYTCCSFTEPNIGSCN